ncbi:C40 family peptidase [Streptomonospora salina]|uniref:Cell wall-associated NlpC family hydrolase n=1 Tax=Streptomonospora salina TaxID=104205 RepID=A0A841E131_9ACTN|nr:C40 family peptidase [Streptomonospora salina]MBB5996835.1 cell wall-associated NlpC family hydrolase [Streptomonospora salina]
MTSTGGRRTARRIATGFGVVAVGSLIVPSGVAYAEPTREEVEATLDDLQEEADGIVQEYNQAQEDYDAAEEKAEDLEERVGDEQERYEGLRDDVAHFASAAYQGNDLDSPASVVNVESPAELLAQSADVGYLSENQKQKLDDFSDSSERLFRLKDEAETALDEAKDKKDESEEKKDEVEEKIEEQEELLAEFPTADPAGGGDDSAGGSYTGAASGDARAALDFAYAQLGKPYVYGSAGPDSYDCSGLVMRSWGAAGVSLPRTTYGQAEAGNRVTRDQLQPGDIVFFFGGLGHDGLYVGNGQMIHAPRSGKNVEVVSLSGYWDGQFQFGVRP